MDGTLQDGSFSVAADAVIVLSASWLSRDLVGCWNRPTIRFSDTPFQTESLPAIMRLMHVLIAYGFGKPAKGP